MPIVTDFPDIKRRMDALSKPETTLTTAGIAEQIEAMMRSTTVAATAHFARFAANSAKIDAQLTKMEKEWRVVFAVPDMPQDVVVWRVAGGGGDSDP